MATILNADTVVGGAIVTGDASGVLALQAAGNTGLTLNSSRAIGVGASPDFGSANQVLQSNGSSAAPTWVAAGSGFSQAQVFTSSGSFTVPASGKFKVTIIGGGGSGSSYNSGSIGSGSGAGGGTVIKWFSGATPGATATVTIGSGGTGVSNAAGNNGGNSTFALSGFSTLTAGGGGGGITYLSQFASTGGTASNGDINSPGSGGTNTVTAGGVANQVGFAGSTLLGFGLVEMYNYNNTGTAGTNGAGSCGRYNNQTTGAGGAGICVVEY